MTWGYKGRKKAAPVAAIALLCFVVPSLLHLGVFLELWDSWGFWFEVWEQGLTYFLTTKNGSFAILWPYREFLVVGYSMLAIFPRMRPEAQWTPKLRETAGSTTEWNIPTSTAGWWWLEPWNFMTFHILGIMIPTDGVIFCRGLKLNHQPASGFSMPLPEIFSFQSFPCKVKTTDPSQKYTADPGTDPGTSASRDSPFWSPRT